MKSSRFLAVFAYACIAVLGTGAHAHAAGVTLRDKGGSVVLDNSAVSVEIGKKDGNVLALEYKGKQILAEPAYLDWHTDRDKHISNGEFSVRIDPAKNNGEMAEVVVRRKSAGAGDNAGAFDIELHHVLRRGDSGFYSYAVFSHPASYPKTGFGQSRMVFRLRDDVFDFINVDDQRRRLMPTAN